MAEAFVPVTEVTWGPASDLFLWEIAFDDDAAGWVCCLEHARGGVNWLGREVEPRVVHTLARVSGMYAHAPSPPTHAAQDVLLRAFDRAGMRASIHTWRPFPTLEAAVEDGWWLAGSDDLPEEERPTFDAGEGAEDADVYVHVALEFTRTSWERTLAAEFGSGDEGEEDEGGGEGNAEDADTEALIIEEVD